MVFEATVHDGSLGQAAWHGPAKSVLILSVGILVGLVLAETSVNTPVGQEFLTTGEIEGQDWHGNVRRSTPAY